MEPIRQTSRQHRYEISWQVLNEGERAAEIKTQHILTADLFHTQNSRTSEFYNHESSKGHLIKQTKRSRENPALGFSVVAALQLPHTYTHTSSYSLHIPYQLNDEGC